MHLLLLMMFLLTQDLPHLNGQRKDSHRIESQYASSLFRQNQILEGVPVIETLGNVSAVSVCLLSCMRHKSDCKAFNWGDSQCVLMSDSVCANESLGLTRKPGFSYYDIMDSPEFEVSQSIRNLRFDRKILNMIAEEAFEGFVLSSDGQVFRQVLPSQT